MTNDEQQIRNVMQTWMDATKNGDLETVLDLMSDDVVFLVAGRKPFGKDDFRRSAEAMKSEAAKVRYEGESNIEEIKIVDTWAFVRNRLKVTTILPNGEETHRSGYTLSIFRKESDGKWRLARDANLLTVEK